MLKLWFKQVLSLALCVALVRPAPMAAEPGAALGSVTPRGVVNVGDVRVPGMSALFAGDQVRTGAGSALIQYQGGSRVVLGLESQASFSPSRVELQKGQMSFSAQAGGPLFAASTLRIEPIGAKAAAEVTYLNHKATVNVTEGAFRVVDPSGAQLASLRAGEARLFEEAVASAPAPAAPPAAAPPAAPAPPQIGGGSNRAWLLALGVGIVGTSLGIAGLVRASDADDRADEAAQEANLARSDAAAAQALAAQTQSQVAAAQAQAAALSATVTALQAQVASLQGSAITQAQIAALASALSSLSVIQLQLNDALADLSALSLSIAAQGGVATPAQLSQLQAVTSRLNSLFQQSRDVQSDINDAVSDLGGEISTTRLP